MSLRWENSLGNRSPGSPCLRPIVSPGPVTPMQLEEDMERLSPRVTPTLKDGEFVTSNGRKLAQDESDEVDHGPRK